MITVHIMLDEHNSPNECGVCKAKLVDNDYLMLCQHCYLIFHPHSPACCSKHNDFHVLRSLAGEASYTISKN